MNEWQPMETAPKGGEAQFVTDPYWIEPPKILLLFDGDICVGYWDSYYAEGGFECTDGFAWIEPCSGEPLNLHYGIPKAWAPLPSTKQDKP
jgi:hypothetical protein